jgi:hypothetical protein
MYQIVYQLPYSKDTGYFSDVDPRFGDVDPPHRKWFNEQIT